jgi:hypothetical protein
MQITVDCKQYQAYQYGEDFIHIESLSGQRRWSDDASLKIEGCGGFGSLDGNANFT